MDATALPDTDHPILLFDGECNLCNTSVQFVIRNDRRAHLRFAALQSDVGRAIGAHFAHDTHELDTVLLYDKGALFARSEAALRTAAYLDWPWRWLSVFRILPVAWRDFIYRWVARNRYRWFGQRDSCMLPTPDIKARFL